MLTFYLENKVGDNFSRDETPLLPKVPYDTRAWRLSVAQIEGAG